jgi:hypothetical protein
MCLSDATSVLGVTHYSALTFYSAAHFSSQKRPAIATVRVAEFQEFPITDFESSLPSL